MTKALRDAVRLVTLAPTGGLQFEVNCTDCAGGLILEAKSRGRDDMAGPCRNVSQVVYCSDCGAQGRVDVVYTTLTQRRTPESRWTTT